MDVYCATCGEPWDCRGLHYTTSDLDADAFYSLINGLCCPCCRDNGVNRAAPDFKLDPDKIEAWRRSVVRASEGLLYEPVPSIVRYREKLEAGVNRLEAAVFAVENAPVTWDMIGAEG